MDLLLNIVKGVLIVLVVSTFGLGVYILFFSNEADEPERFFTSGDITSDSGTLLTPTPDIDKSPDLDSNGEVDLLDFQEFIDMYRKGDLDIDFNNNGEDKRDIGDFVKFQELYHKENE